MYHIHIASKRSCYVYYLLVVAEKTEVRASVFLFSVKSGTSVALGTSGNSQDIDKIRF